MWAEINGERKKVACGPCIRGHRSSKCDHRDRVLVEVRKPGRPLSSCPHPSGSCSCERVVINYTIPKTSECACPSERKQATPSASSSASATNSRVQKNRRRKSTTTLSSASLEKAIKANQETDTDASSLLTRTPTNPSFAPSEKSVSNEASPPSSASSTPRIKPSPSRKPSQSSDIRLPDAPTYNGGDCCRPNPPLRPLEPTQQSKGGSCCSSKGKEIKEPVKPVLEKKSCCSGSSQTKQRETFTRVDAQTTIAPNLGPYPQYHQQTQYQNQPFNGIQQAYPFGMPTNMGMAVPFGFNTPIYNHMAYQPPPASLPMTPTQDSMTHTAEHNCQCGDSCSCFGCAAHPHNATMTEYIRTMHQYMSTGGFGSFPAPTYDLPSYPHHPGFGAETSQVLPFNNGSQAPNFSPMGPTHIPFQGNMASMMAMPSPSVGVPSPWSTQSDQHSLQTSSATDTQYHDSSAAHPKVPTTLKMEEAASSPIFVDSPSEGKDEETPTLSPSSYFWQELVLPCCDDATGTCQCGDGCECVGCLTHGGHNGVRLDDPVTTSADDFSNFLT